MDTYNGSNCRSTAHAPQEPVPQLFHTTYYAVWMCTENDQIGLQLLTPLTGKLLRPDTVNEMFQPHLENVTGLNKPDEYSSVYRNSIWNTIPDDVSISFGIGGLIKTAAVPKRRGIESLTWSVYLNCHWLSPFRYLLVPSGDKKAIKLLTEFEKFVYASLDEQRGLTSYNRCGDSG
ncbi:hypothetical protein B0J13DRAFT_654221 [Dactylonectria estremocensis]|uniref:Beta-lactamase-related domain-containing protein n=1 Tax=Dactylonectria estremocensis TaxID=1079267 RepID=A0A9P9D9U1_9HYPO|nr:hypothetical protein B0J13DRAFT_654221 [Dactylonectria estremocensis]